MYLLLKVDLLRPLLHAVLDEETDFYRPRSVSLCYIMLLSVHERGERWCIRPSSSTAAKLAASLAAGAHEAALLSMVYHPAAKSASDTSSYDALEAYAAYARAELASSVPADRANGEADGQAAGAVHEEAPGLLAAAIPSRPLMQAVAYVQTVSEQRLQAFVAEKRALQEELESLRASSTTATGASTADASVAGEPATSPANAQQLRSALARLDQQCRETEAREMEARQVQQQLQQELTQVSEAARQREHSLTLTHEELRRAARENQQRFDVLQQEVSRFQQLVAEMELKLERSKSQQLEWKRAAQEAGERQDVASEAAERAQRLEELVAQLEGQLESSRAEEAEWRRAAESAARERDELHEALRELQQLERQVAASEAQCAKNERQWQHWKEVATAAQRQCAELERQLAATEQQRRESEQQQQQQQHWKKAATAAQQEYQQLQQTLPDARHWERLLSEAQHRLEETQAQEQEWRRRAAAAEQQHEATRTQLQQSRQQAAAQLQQWQARCQQTRHALHHLSTHLHTQYQQLEQQHRQAVTQLERRLEHAHTRLGQLHAPWQAALRHTRQRAAMEVSGLRERFAQLERAHGQLQANAANAQQRARTAEQELQQARQGRTQLEQDLSQAQRAWDVAASRESELKDKLERLRRELKLREEALREIRHSLESKENITGELFERVGVLEGQLRASREQAAQESQRAAAQWRETRLRTMRQRVLQEAHEFGVKLEEASTSQHELRAGIEARSGTATATSTMSASATTRSFHSPTR